MGSVTTSLDLTSVLPIAGFPVLLVCLLVVLNKRTRRTQRTVKTILQSTSVPTYRQSLVKIRDELTRARRYERALSVAVFRLNGSGPGDNAAMTKAQTAEHSKRFKKSNINSEKIEFLVKSCAAGDFVRSSDILIYDEVRDQIAIVLPETDKSRAASAVLRFKGGLYKKYSDRLSVGISEFPEDGFDIEQLVTHATDFCDDTEIFERAEDNLRPHVARYRDRPEARG